MKIAATIAIISRVMASAVHSFLWALLRLARKYEAKPAAAIPNKTSSSVGAIIANSNNTFFFRI